MLRYLFRAIACGCLLTVTAVLAAHAQAPPSRRTTSAVQQLGLDDSAAAPARVGRLRELWCRGKPGIDLRVDKDPSPRQPSLVAMVLRYERPKATRSFAQEGMGLVDYGVSVQHLPGTCSWNPGGLSGIPAEPGLVYFDLPRDAQAWLPSGDRDTTINAAVDYPDVASLARYLNDQERRWIFYVDDVTGVAVSFTAWPLGGALPMSASSAVTQPPERNLATSRDQRTTDAGSRTLPSPAGSPAGTLRDTSPNRVASARPARAAASPSLAPGAGGVAVDPSGPIGKSSPSRESPGSPGTGRLTDARSDGPSRLAHGIRDVTAAPGPRGVKLSFQADGKVSVQVQFSKDPPRWDQREGRWKYADGWAAPWFARINRFLGSGWYEATPWSTLEAGTRYHYLITVYWDDGSLTRQSTGAFTAAVAP